jgi:hypothetical protein
MLAMRALDQFDAPDSRHVQLLDIDCAGTGLGDRPCESGGSRFDAPLSVHSCKRDALPAEDPFNVAARTADVVGTSIALNHTLSGGYMPSIGVPSVTRKSWRQALQRQMSGRAAGRTASPTTPHT